MALSNTFVHHVYFWLKNPGSTEDRAALAAGLQGLTAIGTIKASHIGRPADTSRNVIDTTYTLSWLALFATAADQDSYQTDPVHLQFVQECAHLWSKVQVYDSINI
jgi:Stress responsive A/B Barrel Domain